jgi:hypothetical protein
LSPVPQFSQTAIFSEAPSLYSPPSSSSLGDHSNPRPLNQTDSAPSPRQSNPYETRPFVPRPPPVASYPPSNGTIAEPSGQIAPAHVLSLHELMIQGLQSLPCRSTRSKDRRTDPTSRHSTGLPAFLIQRADLTRTGPEAPREDEAAAVSPPALPPGDARPPSYSSSADEVPDVLPDCPAGLLSNVPDLPSQAFVSDSDDFVLNYTSEGAFHAAPPQPWMRISPGMDSRRFCS